MMRPPRKLFALIDLATSSQIQVANGAVTVPHYVLGLEDVIRTPAISVVQPCKVAASSRTTLTNSTMSSLRVRQFTTVGLRAI
jgi:hypothetical protein